MNGHAQFDRGKRLSISIFYGKNRQKTNTKLPFQKGYHIVW